MTEDQALARVMEIIRADLPETETLLEIGKVITEYGDQRWQDGRTEGIDQVVRRMTPE